MARKHKHPEHENLERWLVSYADFITLLFATFVVLYALSQSDVSKFSEMTYAMKESFSQSVLEGSKGISQGSDNVMEARTADAILESLILEYMSPKYEEEAFKQIEKEIKEQQKNKELEGIKVKIDDRGLKITLSEDALLFGSGSAELSPNAKLKLDKVGGIIGVKFLLHLMRVEGHTDNIPFSNAKYPSNWELSSARACSVVRYLIDRFKFTPELFSAIGFAETRPDVPNDTEKNRIKNRRVDIVILRNRHKSIEDARDSFLKMDKEQQAAMKEQRLETINRVLSLSDAAKLIHTEDDGKKVIILKDRI